MASELTIYAQSMINIARDERFHLCNIGGGYANIIGAVNGASLIRNGVDMDDTMLKITAKVLWEQIIKDFPTLIIPEVTYAIREGSFGKYGEVYGVNAASLYQMVKAYSESAQRYRLKNMLENEKRIKKLQQ